MALDVFSQHSTNSEELLEKLSIFFLPILAFSFLQRAVNTYISVSWGGIASQPRSAKLDQSS